MLTVTLLVLSHWRGNCYGNKLFFSWASKELNFLWYSKMRVSRSPGNMKRTSTDGGFLSPINWNRFDRDAMTTVLYQEEWYWARDGQNKLSRGLKPCAEALTPFDTSTYSDIKGPICELHVWCQNCFKRGLQPAAASTCVRQVSSTNSVLMKRFLSHFHVLSRLS